MSSEGARKAAMLLMTLDPPTAGELLRSATPETVTEIAAEVAYLSQAGAAAVDTSEGAWEFIEFLHNRAVKTSDDNFAKQMVQIALGKEQSQQVLLEIDDRVIAMDPFRKIREAEAKAIASALAGESAQTVALVLSELAPQKSTELFQLLDEAVRSQTVARMAAVREISPKAKRQLAGIVQGRLEKAAADRAAAGQADQAPVDDDDDGAGVDQQHRKVALLLRGMELEQRTELMTALAKQDSESADGVRKMSMVWEDLLLVEDLCIQEALRSVDSRKLALAMIGVASNVLERVLTNISERAKAMLEEEESLLSSPKDDDIQQARESILDALRAIDAKGELTFKED